ncbi:hypothetical protein VNO77_34358 [Canavalia gladiata]|uniref:Uncharacterized protein n=1 Tax=Canavalia gladiata TaxID=3824 RepID=A0AAN9Q1Q3_CANGL
MARGGLFESWWALGLDEPCRFLHALLRPWLLVCGCQGLLLPAPFGIWVKCANVMAALLVMVTYDDAKGVAYGGWIVKVKRESKATCMGSGLGSGACGLLQWVQILCLCEPHIGRECSLLTGEHFSSGYCFAKGV